MPSAIIFTAATCHLNGLQLENDEQARTQAELTIFRIHACRCVSRDGSRIECPNLRQITKSSGWFRSPLHTEYDLAIYGAGPAGLSAAV